MEQQNEYSFMNAPSATDRFNILQRRKMEKAARLTLETMERAGVSFHVVTIPVDDGGIPRTEFVLVARMDGSDIATFPYSDNEIIGG